MVEAVEVLRYLPGKLLLLFPQRRQINLRNEFNLWDRDLIGIGTDFFECVADFFGGIFAEGDHAVLWLPIERIEPNGVSIEIVVSLVDGFATLRSRVGNAAACALVIRAAGTTLPVRVVPAAPMMIFTRQTIPIIAMGVVGVVRADLPLVPVPLVVIAAWLMDLVRLRVWATTRPAMIAIRILLLRLAKR